MSATASSGRHNGSEFVTVRSAVPLAARLADPVPVGLAGFGLVLTHIGGAFGIATGLLAWYVSFAETLHNTIGKALAPLVPFGSKVVDEPPHAMREYQPVAEQAVS